MAFSKLFEPIKIRDLELKNRVILPAMGTKFANEDSSVSQQLIDYHIARAKGGCGLNIVEVAGVHGASTPRGFVGIYDDKFLDGLKALTKAIKDAGGKASIQLWQGGLAASFDPQCQILLPSPMPISAEVTIPQASVEQIEEIIECYGQAAKRAVKAGFDSIEIHCAHNYMLHSFLSPYFNRRQDEYGGTLENRMRLPLAVIKSVRDNIPEGMPLFIRIGAHDDFLEGGLTIEDIIIFCKEAKKLGVDVLDVSRGNIVSAGIQYEVPPIDLPRGFNIENASRIRKETGMLTIGVGRINDPQQAEDILANDKVDMVVMGRAQLADPDFCNKAHAGEVDSIVRCIGCNQGCYDGFADKTSPHITCLMNPAVGREKEFEITKTSQPKKVLIAGGGIAGLKAAIELKQRGHNPILCESTNNLGGQFLIAGLAPRKQEMREAVIGLGKQVLHMGVDVRLKTLVTPELIKEIKPDVLFNAIGAIPIIPQIEGSNLKNVYDSHDILDGRVHAQGKVNVIGGGLVGLEVAEFLQAQGLKISIIEMQPEIGIDLGDIRKATVLGNIYQEGINVITNAKVIEIKEDKVITEVEGDKKEVECDCTVIAIGAKSRDGSVLEHCAKELDIPYYVIGDAKKARRALNAVAEALDAVMSLNA